MIKAYPKIFTLGTRYIDTIFDDPVEITCKLDGSQWVFGKVNGQLYMRSKGKVQHAEAPDKMFTSAVDYVSSIQDLLPEGLVFYCEYLRVPKHNTLCYSRIPKNHLALFGVSDVHGSDFSPSWEILRTFAEKFDIDPIPLLYHGKINSSDELIKFLDYESYLGGCKVEGVVVKNYHKQFLLGGQPIPLMMGKFVSEAFKEVHQSIWKKEHTGKGRFETFCDSYRSEARWRKAIQHFDEDGKLEFSPRDIGSLIKEIQRDIKEEEIEAIKDFLFQEFGSQVMRAAIRGFPEWYKEFLLKLSMGEAA